MTSIDDSKVIVTGAAQTGFNRRKDNSSFRDWAAQAFDAALGMAGIEPAEIDALLVASESDFFSLQLNPVALFASELGLDGVAGTRCEAGGASGQAAVQAAASAVLSGQARHVAVIGVDPSASSLSGDMIRTLYGFSFDAMTDGFSGVTATALYALSWQVFAAEHGLGETELALVTQHNRTNACSNPDAHLPRSDTVAEIAKSPVIASPYRRLHCSPLSDGAAALILSHTDHVPADRRRAPRIAGMGAATDHMHLGARDDPGAFSAKRDAMQRACRHAGIAPGNVGLAEVYDSYAGAQLQGLTALGLSDNPGADLKDGAFGPDGRCPVNLSGGLMGQGAPVGAIGVAQVATCARILEGRYHGELQLPSPPAYALADTHGAVCTTAAVTVLQNGGAA
ncbi:MAG: thiolase family protein [Pseudomonadota bacterium]